MKRRSNKMRKFNPETAKLEYGITKWDIYQFQKDCIDDGEFITVYQAYSMLLKNAKENAKDE